MRDTQRTDNPRTRRTGLTLATLAVAISVTACSRAMMIHFIVTGEHRLDRAYKVPSLRNVAERPPYVDAGQFATLADVLDHDNRAPAAASGHSELRPLRLKAVELRQLEAFLRMLSGPVSVTEPAPARRSQ